MESILLSNQVDKLYSVYNEKILNEIEKHTIIKKDICFTKDDLFNNKEAFKNVKYIFSSWGMVTLNKEEVRDIFPNLKHIFYGAGSVQYFAKPFMDNQVLIHSAYLANAIPVAQFTLSQIMLSNKNYFLNSIEHTKGNIEKAYSIRNKVLGNYNSKIGILGAGAIGSKVIEYLNAMGNFEIYVFDPFLSDTRALELQVIKSDLSTIFKNCNIISNHLADNDQTKGILDYKFFSLMPDYSTFINTGRGAQVIENDLVRALEENPTLFALLDVTYPEPPKEDSLLYSRKNILISSHIAGALANEHQRMSEYMYNDFLAVLKNQEPKYIITKKMLETMA